MTTDRVAVPPSPAGATVNFFSGGRLGLSHRLWRRLHPHRSSIIPVATLIVLLATNGIGIIARNVLSRGRGDVVTYPTTCVGDWVGADRVTSQDLDAAAAQEAFGGDNAAWPKPASKLGLDTALRVASSSRLAAFVSSAVRQALALLSSSAAAADETTPPAAAPDSEPVATPEAPPSITIPPDEPAAPPSEPAPPIDGADGAAGEPAPAAETPAAPDTAAGEAEPSGVTPEPTTTPAPTPEVPAAPPAPVPPPPGSLTCSGFAPDTAGDFSGAAIGLSLGLPAGAPGTLVVEASTDQGVTWQPIATVPTGSDASNETNGGYWLYDADLFASWNDIANGLVRVRPDPLTEAPAAFVDALWIETRAKRLAADELPVTPVLTAEDETFTADEEPTFLFEANTIPQTPFSNLLNTLPLPIRGADAAAAGLASREDRRREWKEQAFTIEVGLLRDGEPTDITPTVKKNGKGKFSFSIESRFFRPGKYTLEVAFTKDGQTKISTQNFTWGVLVVNPDQSVYQVGDVANLAFGVLTEEGNTVCDADLTLAVADPDGAVTTLSTADGTIQPSGKCGPNNVTDIPDYAARYQTTTAGTYRLQVTATTANGSRTVTDDFTAEDTLPYRVRRLGASRIWPLAAYTMKLEVTAADGFSGTVNEFVPKGFVITPQDGLTITDLGEEQALAWNVALAPDEKRTLSYQYDAPDVSPEIFKLGRVELTATDGLEPSFTESRYWLLASDAVTVGTGRFIYNKSGATSEQLRSWGTGTTYPPGSTTFQGGDSLAANTTATKRWPRIVASPVTNGEFMAAFLTSSNTSLNVQTCLTGSAGNCTAAADWSAANPLRGFTVGVSATARQSYDIAYEQLSGKGLVVYGDSASPTKFQYGTFTAAGGWSSGAQITTSTTRGNVEWVKLLPRPNSNDIALVWADSSNDIWGFVWNGSAWGNEITSSRNTTLDTNDLWKFDAAWQADGSRLMVVSSNSATIPKYYTYVPGTGWDTGATTMPTFSSFAAAQIKLFASPYDNHIGFAGMTQNTTTANVKVGMWNGTSWTNNDSAIFTAGRLYSGTTTTNGVSGGWLNSTTAVVGYSSQHSYLHYVTWSGGAWGSDQTSCFNGAGTCNLTASSLMNWIEIYSNAGDGNIRVAMGDSSGATSTLAYVYYAINCSTTCDWSYGNGTSPIETSLSDNIDRQFDFAASPTQVLTTVSGTVYTTPPSTTPIGNVSVCVIISGGSTENCATSDAGTGVYTISNAVLAWGKPFSVYIKDATQANKGSLVTTYGGGTSLSGLNLYQNYLTIRSDAATSSGFSATSNAMLAACDNTTCNSYLRFAVSSNNLTTDSGIGLYIAASNTFAPGGNVTVAGNFNNAGTFTAGTNTVTLTGTGSQTITSGSSTTFYDLIQNGVAGTYTLQDALTVSNDLTITAGTLAGGANAISVGGDWSNSGTFTHSGTVTMTGANATVAFYEKPNVLTANNQYTSVALAIPTSTNIPQFIYKEQTNKLMYRACANADCSSMSAAINVHSTLTNSSSTTGLPIALTTDANGKATIAYPDVTGANVYLARQVDSGGNGCSDPNHTFTGCTSIYNGASDGALRMVMGPAVTPYPRLLFIEGNTLKYMACDDSDCAGEGTATVASVTNAETADFKLGADGFARIVYKDTSGNLKFVQCTNLSCSTNAAVQTLVTGLAISTGSVRLALDQVDLAGVVYQDTTGYLEYLHCTASDCATKEGPSSTALDYAATYSDVAFQPNGRASIAVATSRLGTSSAYMLSCISADCATSTTANLDNLGITVPSGLALALNSRGSPVFFVADFQGYGSIYSCSVPTCQNAAYIKASNSNFNNLMINGSGKTFGLGAAVTVAGTLTLTAGTLDTGGWSTTDTHAARMAQAPFAITVGASSNVSWSNGGGAFNPRNQTVTFNKTSGTNTITSGANDVFYDVVLNGSGGTFQPADALRVANDLTVTAGTLALNNQNVTVNGGDIVGAGSITCSGCTTAMTTITGSGNLGGTSSTTPGTCSGTNGAYTFYNLTFGNAGTAKTTTSCGTFTTSGDVQVTANHSLYLNSKAFTVNGGDFYGAGAVYCGTIATPTTCTSVNQTISGNSEDGKGVGGPNSTFTFGNFIFSGNAQTTKFAGNIATAQGFHCGNGTSHTCDTTVSNYSLTVGSQMNILGIASGTGSTFNANNSTVTIGTLLYIAWTTQTGTLNAGGATISVGASATGHFLCQIFVTGSGTFNAGTSTIQYQQNIDGTCVQAVTYYNLTLNPTLTADRVYAGAAAALTVTNDLMINPTASSTTKRLTFNLGGATTVTGTTTITGSDIGVSTLDVRPSSTDYNLTTGSLNIASAGTLDATSSAATITLTGTGSPFSLSGTFTVGTSTVKYTGAGATNITAATYYNLESKPAGTYTHTLAAGTVTASNNFTVGNGTNAVTVTAATNNPAVTVTGTFSVAAGATYTGGSGGLSVAGDFTLANTATFTKGSETLTLKPTGTKTLTDSNGTKQDLGTVSIASGSATPKITLGSSVKATSVTIAASHELDANGANTLTLTGTGTPLTATGTFTGSTGTVAYTGDGSVTVASAPSYYNLTLSPTLASTDQTYTAGGALTVTHDLMVNPTASSTTKRLTLNPAGTITVTNLTTLTGTTTGVSTIKLRPVATDYNLTTSSLTVASAGTLDAGGSASMITVTGTGTPFTVSGTFTPGTSTVTYTGDGAVTTAATTYNNLTLSPTITLARTYTLGGATTVNGAWSLNPSAGSALALTVNLGGTTSVSGATTVSGAGAGPATSTLDTTASNYALTSSSVTVSSGSTLNARGSTVTLTGTGTPFTVSGTFTPGTSTVTYTGDGAVTVASAPSYYNLQLSPTLVSTDQTYMAGGALTVTNNLTLNPTASTTIKRLTLNAAGTITVTGTTTIRGTTTGTSLLDLRPATTDYDLSTGTLDIQMSNTLDAGSAASTITLTGTSGTLFTRAGTFTQGSSTVVMNPNASVTLTSGTVTFYNLTLSPTLATSDKTYNFGNLILVENNFTVSPTAASTLGLTVNLGGIINNATGTTNVAPAGSATASLDTTGSSHALSASTLNVAAGGTLVGNGSNITIYGTGTAFNLNGADRFTEGTSTVIYTHGTSANVTATAYYNLQTNGAGTYTLATGTTTVTNDLTVTAGTLALNSQNLTVNGGDITGTGTISCSGCSAGTVTLDGTGNIDGGTYTFYNLTLGDGSGTTTTTLQTGTYTVSNDLAVAANQTLALNSISLAVNGGDITGTGTISCSGCSGGTVTLDGAGNLGGGTYTFYNLTLGDGTGATATTATGSFTVQNVLTVAINQTFNGGTGSYTHTLSGSGTPFVVNGTFTGNTDTMSYTGTSATNVATANTTYYNLSLVPAGTVTYTLGTGTVTASNNFTVGNGTNAVTVTAATNNPAVTVTGTFSVAAGATYTGGSGGLSVAGDFTLANTATFTKGSETLTLKPTGTKTLTDSNGTKQDLGTVSIASGASTPKINLGSSVKTTSVTIAASHELDANGANTLTLTGGSTPFTVSGAFTPSTGTIVYTGASPTVTATTYYNLTLNGSGTYGLSGNLTASGTLTVTAGTFPIGANTVSGGTITVNGGTLTMLTTGGVLKVGTGGLAMSSGTIQTYDVATAPVLTTSGVEGTNFFPVSFTGGTLDVSEWDVRSVASTGIVIDSGVTITNLNKLTLSNTFQTTAGTDVMVDITGQTATFTNWVFPVVNGAREINVRANVSGNIIMSGWSGAFGGEAYDSDNGGTVFWGITISGTLYTDEGTTALTGSSKTIALKVNGADGCSGACSASTNAGNGTFSINNIQAAANDVVTVWVDGDVTVKAAAVSHLGSATVDLSGFNLYQSRVIVRSENANPVTLTDLNQYDADNDTDIQFTATIGAPNTVSVASGNELHVGTGDTFTPGGNVTANGDVHVVGTFTATSTESHSVGGSWTDTGTFNPASSTVTFTATSGTKTLTSTGSSFYNLVVNGSGGTFQPQDALAVTNDLTMTAGTLSGTQNVTVNGAAAGTAGVVTLTGGTFEERVAAGKNFGPTTASTSWTFSTLTFSNSNAGATPVTVTAQLCSTCGVTVSSVLNVGKTGDAAGATTTLSAGDKTWTLSGTGTPLVLLASPASTFTASTSTVVYTHATSANVTATTYYNLQTNGAGTYTLVGTTAITNDLTVTAGTLNMNVQNLTVNGGDITGAGTISCGGCSGGTVTLDGAGSIDGGAYTFYNLTLGDGSGATTTTLQAGTYLVLNNLSVAANQTLALNSISISVGGGNITGTGTIVCGNGDNTCSAGTVTLTTTGNLGGGAYTFYNLTLGNGFAATTTTAAGNFTVQNVLTVTAGTEGPATDHTLNAGSATITLAGAGTVLNMGGTDRLTENASTFVYTGDGSVTVAATTYYNLQLTPTITQARAYTFGGAVTVNNNFDVNPTAGSALALTVNPAGTITVTGTTTLTGTTSGISTLDLRPSTTDYNLSTGTLNIASAGTLDAAGAASTITLTGTSGTLFTRAGTFTAGSSSVVMNPNASVTLTSGTVTFYNLQLAPTLATSSKTYAFGSGAITVSNNFDVNPSAGSALALTVNLGADITVTGTTTITRTTSATSTLDLRPSTIDYNLTTGMLNVAAGGTLDATAAASTITLTGIGTPFTLTGTFTAGTSTVVYSGATTATNVTATTYYNLNLGGSGTTTTYTAAGDLTVSNILTIVSSSGTNTFDASSRTVTLSGTGTPFVISASEVFTPSTSTVVYSGDGAVTVTATTYNHLTLSPTITAGRVYTMGGAVTVNGNLDINPSAGSALALTVNLGGTTTVAGSTTIRKTSSATSTVDTVSVSNHALSSGTIDLQAGGTLTAQASTITLTGTSGTLFTRAGTFTQGTSTVVMNPNASVTLTSGTVTFYNLQLTPTLATSGKTYTFGSGAVTVSNNFDVNPTAASALALTVNLGAAISVTGTASVAPTGSATASLDTTASSHALSAATVSVAAGGTLVGNGSTITVSGAGTPFNLNGADRFTEGTSTVTYTGASPTVTATTYNNLTLSGSGTYGLSGNLTASGTLTVTAGTFPIGANTVSAGTVTVNNGTLTMLTTGGVLKVGTGGLTLSSGTLQTADVSPKPILTTSGTEGTHFFPVSFTGGTLDISSWDVRSVASTTVSAGRNGGIVVGASVVVTNFNKVTLANNFQTTGGAGDALVDIDSQTATLNTWVFPSIWTSGEVNIRARNAGTVAMTGWSGGFGGETNDEDYNGGTVFWGITLSGTLYTDEGTTALTGSSKTIALKVNGADGCSGACTTTTNAGDGTFSINNIQAAVNDVVTMWVDGDVTVKAAAVSHLASATADLSGFNLYQSRVITRSENANPVTITDLNQYDADNDTDIQFTATLGAPKTVSIAAGNELHVWTGDTFTPGGNVTANGDVHIVGTFTATTTETHSVGGSWTNAGTFTKASSTVTFTATSGTKTITSTGSSFYNLVVNGSGGTFQPQDALAVTNDLTMTAGTLSGAQNVTVNGAAVGAAGVINLTGGTFEQRMAASKNFGPTTASTSWTFSTLTFSNSNAGATPVTVTAQSCSTCGVTVSSVLNIGKSGDAAGATTTLSAGDKTWTLSGTGTPLVLLASPAATFTAATSTVNYTGASPSLTSATYYNATFNGSGTATLGGNITSTNVFTIQAGTLDAGSRTLTLWGSSTPFVIAGAFTPSTSTVVYSGASPTVATTTYNTLNLSGSGTASIAAGTLNAGDLNVTNGAVTAATNNPTINVAGNLSLSLGTTYTKGSGTTTFAGTGKTITDSTSGQDLGAVVVNGTIAASSNLIATSLTINTAKSLDISNRTLTLTGSGTPLTINGALTTTGSTVAYTSSTGATVTAASYHNLAVGTASSTATYILAGDTTVNGSLAVTSSSGANTLDMTNRTLTLNGSGTPLNLGSNAALTTAGSTVIYANETSATVTTSPYNNLQFNGAGAYSLGGTTNVGGTLTITSGTLDATASNYALNIAGNWTATGGSFTARQGTVTLTATTSGKTIATNGSAFYNLTLNGTGADWTLQDATTTVTNALAVSAGELKLNGKNLTVNGGTLTNAGTISCTNCSAGTVTVSGTGNLGSTGSTTVYNLTTNGSGVTTLAGTVTILNDATVGTGHSLALASQNLNLSGNLVATGEVTCSSCTGGTLTMNGSGKSISGAGNFTVYNLTAAGSTSVTSTGTKTILNNLLINNGSTLTGSNGTLNVGGNWTNNGVYVHNNGTVAFMATATGKTISDGGSAFKNLIFNGAGGGWTYTDGQTVTATTVQNGTAQLLNTVPGTVSVTGGALNVDWYLNIHVVNKNQTSTAIATAGNDITVVEASDPAASTIFTYAAGWGNGAASATVGTDASGDTPAPGTAGALRLREYSNTAGTATYYRYNVTVAAQPGYRAYDYFTDYGGAYLTSAANLGGGLDSAIAATWRRAVPATVPSPDTVNEPTTTGTWHLGLTTAAASGAGTTAAAGGGVGFFSPTAFPPLAPTARFGQAIPADAIRWHFTDNASNETGFVILDQLGRTVAATPPWITMDLDHLDEAGLQLNTRYVGRRAAATNSSGSNASEEFPSTYTPIEVPAALALVSRTTTSVGLHAAGGTPDGAFSNLTDGYSGLLFENLTTGERSGWIQSADYLFAGLQPDTEYRLRVSARNGDGVTTLGTAELVVRTAPAEAARLPRAATAPVVLEPDLDIALPTGTFTLRGSADPYATVTLVAGGATVTTVADSRGQFAFNFSDLENGRYTLTLRASDADGNRSATTTVTIKVAAPTPPVVPPPGRPAPGHPAPPRPARPRVTPVVPIELPANIPRPIPVPVEITAPLTLRSAAPALAQRLRTVARAIGRLPAGLLAGLRPGLDRATANARRLTSGVQTGLTILARTPAAVVLDTARIGQVLGGRLAALPTSVSTRAAERLRAVAATPTKLRTPAALRDTFVTFGRRTAALGRTIAADTRTTAVAAEQTVIDAGQRLGTLARITAQGSTNFIRLAVNRTTESVVLVNRNITRRSETVRRLTDNATLGFRDTVARLSAPVAVPPLVSPEAGAPSRPSLGAGLRERLVAIGDAFDILRAGLTLPAVTPTPLASSAAPVVSVAPRPSPIPTNLPPDQVVAKTPFGDITLGSDDGLKLLAGMTFRTYLRPSRAVRSIEGRLILEKPLDENTAPNPNFFFNIPAAGAANVAVEAIERRIKRYEIASFPYQALAAAPEQNTYTALISVPPIAGEYVLQTIVTIREGDEQVLETRMLTDPEGYVYSETDRGQEERIRDAVVTLYYQKEGSGFSLWPAAFYDQRNPQTTDRTGQYSFFVPRGTYYLAVEREGYRRYRSEPFTVQDGAPVHQNIALEEIPTSIFDRLFQNPSP